VKTESIAMKDSLRPLQSDFPITITAHHQKPQNPNTCTFYVLHKPKNFTNKKIQIVRFVKPITLNVSVTIAEI